MSRESRGQDQQLGWGPRLGVLEGIGSRTPVSFSLCFLVGKLYARPDGMSEVGGEQRHA